MKHSDETPLSGADPERVRDAVDHVEDDRQHSDDVDTSDGNALDENDLEDEDDEDDRCDSDDDDDDDDCDE